jgi:hypothetical protein
MLDQVVFDAVLLLGDLEDLLRLEMRVVMWRKCLEGSIARPQLVAYC